MPYSIKYRPTKGEPPWAKINKETGRIVSRHRSKAKAQASIRAYYATRNCDCRSIFSLNVGRIARKDPTRTTMIQRRFMGDIKRRFKNLKTAVKNFLITQDELGLGARKSFVMMQREFQFRTDAGKLQAFSDWFAQQVQANILSVPPGTPLAQPWTAKYVESAYKKGLTNAFIASRQGISPDAADALTQSQEQFLRSSFGQPEAVSKVQLLATRAFEELKGVSSTMSSQMNRILAQGLIDGSGPAEIASEMSGSIDSLTETRALLIARTETINAHAEGQLDGFEDLGIDELGVLAEWSTAGDDRVCELCAAKEGETFTVEEARGLIPLHPNCRCAWIPKVPEPIQQ